MWTPVANMNGRRLQFGVAVLDDKLYVVGGRDGLKTLNTVECYNPKTKTWSVMPPMSTHRHGLGRYNCRFDHRVVHWACMAFSHSLPGRRRSVWQLLSQQQSPSIPPHAPCYLRDRSRESKHVQKCACATSPRENVNIAGVPVVAQRKRIQLGSMRMRI